MSFGIIPLSPDDKPDGFVLLSMYEKLESENAKLHDSLKALMMGTNVELCADRDSSQCQECSMALGEHRCAMSDAMELLGIDMYGEPLEVKS